jgi:DNA-binding protein H-NS
MESQAIENLSDAELEALAARAQEMLKVRQGQKRQEAIEQARSILEAVGLTFRDAEQMAERERKRNPVVKPQHRQGARFVNPANPEQSWTAGKGRKPKWLTELEAKGEAPEAS